jgi:arylsulfatase A-like enzyme
MSSKTESYRSTVLLAITTWWGLVAGTGEGLAWYCLQSPIWHDVIRASLVVNGLLFLGAGLVLALLHHRRSVNFNILVRVTIGCSFLAFYCWAARLLPAARNNLLPFLSAFLATGLVGVLIYKAGEKCIWFQERSLPVLIVVALWCVLVFPIQERRNEKNETARLAAVSANAQNVLVVVVDTMGADHLSTYGYARLTSPNLTKIAEQGVLFENAVAPSSWTLPSHASILTGLYPHAHRTAAYSANLGSEYPTLAEVLRSRGYRTAAFSGNTGTFCRQRGFGRGFMHFEDDFQNWGSMLSNTYYGGKLANLLVKLRLVRDLPGRVDAPDLRKRAFQWIDSDAKPFFAFINFYDLHDPYLPPGPYVQRYTNVKNPGGWFTPHWEWFQNLTPEQREAARDAYDGAVNYADDQIAELMRQLEHRGLSKNTLVVITSDHGEAFYEHGLMNHGNSLYREVTHVPLIFWAPGSIPAGKRIADPVSLTAVPATVLRFVNQSDSGGFTQASLTALWTQNAVPAEIEAPVSELAQMSWSPLFPNYYGPMVSVTTPAWHYVAGGNKGEQLFHCCQVVNEGPDVSSSVEGKKVCAQFRDELRVLTAERGEQWARSGDMLNPLKHARSR